jgi:hypothetical protein
MELLNRMQKNIKTFLKFEAVFVLCIGFVTLLVVVIENLS